MRNVNITNMDQFFRVVDECEGRVELVTKNGDRLNLKSTLCQYISMVKFFSEDWASDIEIVTHNVNDAQRLCGYISTF